MDLDIGAYEALNTAENVNDKDQSDFILRCLPAEVIISANRTKDFKGDKLVTSIFRAVWPSAKGDLVDPRYGVGEKMTTLLHHLCRSDHFVYLLQCFVDAGVLSPEAFSTLNERGET